MSDQPSRAPDTMATNVGFSLAVRITGGVFTTVLTLFLVRALDPAGYGTFALALSIGTLVLIPANLGVSQAAARFVAEHRGDHVSAARVVSDAFRLKIAASVVFSLGLIALAEPIAAAYDTPELAWPLRLMAIAVFGQSMLLLCDAIFEAVGRLGLPARVVLGERHRGRGVDRDRAVRTAGQPAPCAGRAAAYAFARDRAGARGPDHRRAASARRREGHGHARRIAVYGSALLVVDGAFAAVQPDRACC